MNVLGCDISKWQPGFDFNKARSAGLSFMFIKATDGYTTDPVFQEHWDTSLGWRRGAYHWFQPALLPVTQARTFVDAVNPGPEEILAVDLEEKRGASSLLPVKLLQFLEELERMTDNQIVLYTNPAYWLKWFSACHWADRYPLWIANYMGTAPSIPLPWAPTRWTFWQFTARANGPKYGTDPARSKSIDLDLFNGSGAELADFWARTR